QLSQPRPRGGRGRSVFDEDDHLALSLCRARQPDQNEDQDRGTHGTILPEEHPVRARQRRLPKSIEPARVRSRGGTAAASAPSKVGIHSATPMNPMSAPSRTSSVSAQSPKPAPAATMGITMSAMRIHR